MFHITTAPHPRSVAWLASLAVALAACESTGPGSRALSLSVTTKSATSTSMATASADASGAALSLSAAQVTLKEIELNTTGTNCEAETDNADATGTSGDAQEAQDEQNEDCAELELGPLQVNLPLDPTTQLILDALVPACAAMHKAAKDPPSSAPKNALLIARISALTRSILSRPAGVSVSSTPRRSCGLGRLSSSPSRAILPVSEAMKALDTCMAWATVPTLTPRSPCR